MKLGQKIAINYIKGKLNLLALVSKKKAAEAAFELFCTPRHRSKKVYPPIFNKAEKLSIKVEGNLVKGFRWNKGGSKKVLVLHGFESSSKNFERYINPLIKKNYEVLAFDAPAHGISGGKQITLPLYIKTIQAVYDRYGPIQSFVSHSFGGLAIIHFMERAPHDAQTHIALIAPATETKTAIDTFFSFLQLDDDVRKVFEQLIKQKSGLDPYYYSIPRALQHINASILWVHDTNDEVTPIRDVRPVMEKQYPNIRFMITEGLGHRNIYRDTKVNHVVTDFL